MANLTNKQVVTVFKTLLQKFKDRPDLYDNDLGCGNCGDLGPSFKTLSTLANGLAATMPKAQRARFLNSIGLTS
jgi:hypothetical protein